MKLHNWLLFASAILCMSTTALAEDDDIEELFNEQTKTRKDVERIEKETKEASKAMAGDKAKLEKMRNDLKLMQGLRAEKQKQFLELTTQHDRVVEQIKEMEAEVAKVEMELGKAKEEEKATLAKLQRVRAEEEGKKKRLEAHIAGLRQRYKETADKVAQMDAEIAQQQANGQRLEATAKAAEQEVNDMDAKANNRMLATIGVAATPSSSSSSDSASSGGDLTFKRKCRAFETPAKGAKVLETMESGASVTKSEEGKTWYAFTLNGRKAYAAKNCFN